MPGSLPVSPGGRAATTARPWTVRPERSGDAEGIRHVHTSAFGGPEEAALVDALRARAAPLLSLVASAPRGVVGHILFSPVLIPGLPGAPAAMGLAPIGVLPTHQRRGVGAALIERGLAECRRRGHHVVVVLGDPAYYAGFGFVPAAAHGLRCEFPAPPGAFRVACLVPGALRGAHGLVRYRPELSRL